MYFEFSNRLSKQPNQSASDRHASRVFHVYNVNDGSRISFLSHRLPCGSRSTRDVRQYVSKGKSAIFTTDGTHSFRVSLYGQPLRDVRFARDESFSRRPIARLRSSVVTWSSSRYSSDVHVDLRGNCLSTDKRS